MIDGYTLEVGLRAVTREERMAYDGNLDASCLESGNPETASIVLKGTADSLARRVEELDDAPPAAGWSLSLRQRLEQSVEMLREVARAYSKQSGNRDLEETFKVSLGIRSATPWVHAVSALLDELERQGHGEAHP